jgi:hypothetical protein
MNRKDRSVRFRDILAISEARCSSPIPIISPSLRNEKVNVLHSIFSPSHFAYHDASKNTLTNTNVLQSGYLDRRAEILDSSQDIRPPLWKTPYLAKKHTKPQVDNIIPSAGCTTEDRNVYNHEFSERTISLLSSMEKFSNTPTPSEQFFTPAMTSMSATPHGTKTNREIPLEAMINAHVDSNLSPLVSFSPKDFPLSMLRLPFIQRCTSVHELKQIIDVLETKTEYPTLVLYAKRRIVELCGDSICESLESANKNDVKNNARPERGPPRCKSLLQPGTYEYENTVNNVAINRSETTRLRNDRGHIRIGETLNNDSNELFVNEATARITHLTETISEMEKLTVVERSTLQRRIDNLQKENQAAAQKLKALQTRETHNAKEATTNQQQLQRTLEEVQRDRLALQEKLSADQRVYRRGQKRAVVLEEKLTKEIKALQERVVSMTTSSESQNKLMEERCKNLNRLLKSAQRHLEDTKKERDAMISVISDILGDRCGFLKMDVSCREMIWIQL